MVGSFGVVIGRTLRFSISIETNALVNEICSKWENAELYDQAIFNRERGFGNLLLCTRVKA